MKYIKLIKSERDLSKILTPEDFDKIESEIESLSIAKKRIQDSMKSYIKAGNFGTEYQSLLKELDKVNNQLSDKFIQQTEMLKELNRRDFE